MIYTVISDAFSRKIDNINKEDCRILRQPLPVLPDEILDYINKTNNECLRAERFRAYTSLFASLCAFFGVENAKIEKNKNGKPYFVPECGIFFSISHSDGAVAIVLSDEGEVGVDIQSEISEEREKRLKKRFIKDVMTEAKKESKCFFMSIEDGECLLYKILPNKSPDVFTKQWTVAESLIKLTSDGFSAINKIDESALPYSVENFCFAMEDIIYFVSVASGEAYFNK